MKLQLKEHYFWKIEYGLKKRKFMKTIFLYQFNSNLWLLHHSFLQNHCFHYYTDIFFITFKNAKKYPLFQYFLSKCTTARDYLTCTLVRLEMMRQWNAKMWRTLIRTEGLLIRAGWNSDVLRSGFQLFQMGFWRVRFALTFKKEPIKKITFVSLTLFFGILFVIHEENCRR